MDYSQEHDEFLRTSRAQGLSYAQVREQFEQQFGAPVTRNAVILRCTRIGAQGPGLTLATVARTPRVKPPLAKGRKSVWQLTDACCRYIPGEPSEGYCGAPSSRGHYCEEHRQVMFMDTMPGRGR